MGPGKSPFLSSDSNRKVMESDLYLLVNSE